MLLSLGRIVLGFAVGGATQTAPMYVAELAPPKYRGRLVLAFQIAIGVGIVIATVVGASESIVWRWSIGIAAVPAAIMLALLVRLPESPRWLVRNDDRRRRLTLIMIPGAAVALFVLGLLFVTGHAGRDDQAPTCSSR